jgi:hypothetical protein
LKSKESSTMADPTTSSPPAPDPAIDPALTLESSDERSDSKPTADTVKLKSEIRLRSPRKYNIAEEGEKWTPPPLEWLEGTWSVTHSTLPMWRKAKNVRITYKVLPPANPGGEVCLDDLVENEPTVKV